MNHTEENLRSSSINFNEQSVENHDIESSRTEKLSDIFETNEVPEDEEGHKYETHEWHKITSKHFIE